MRVRAAQEGPQQVPSGGHKADRPLPVAAAACAQARREAVSVLWAFTAVSYGRGQNWRREVGGYGLE